MQRAVSTLLIVAMSCAAAWLPAAKAEPISRSVDLVIEKLGVDAEPCGFGEASIRDQAASALAAANWRVDLSVPDFVYVSVSVLHMHDDQCAYTVIVNLWRMVRAQSGKPMPAITSERSTLGVASAQRARAEIRGAADRLTRELIDSAEAHGL